jgi:hypothetical protein
MLWTHDSIRGRGVSTPSGWPPPAQPAHARAPDPRSGRPHRNPVAERVQQGGTWCGVLHTASGRAARQADGAPGRTPSAGRRSEVHAARVRQILEKLFAQGKDLVTIVCQRGLWLVTAEEKVVGCVAVEALRRAAVLRSLRSSRPRSGRGHGFGWLLVRASRSCAPATRAPAGSISSPRTASDFFAREVSDSRANRSRHGRRRVSAPRSIFRASARSAIAMRRTCLGPQTS